jgi:hypothetical protein
MITTETRLTQPRRTLPIPFVGVPLLRADYLDTTYQPGLLVAVMKSRGAMRHACFATLESISLTEDGKRRQAADCDVEYFREISALMMKRSASELTQAVRRGAPVPQQYLAVLARLGSAPLPFGQYARLIACFERRDQRARLLCRISGQITNGMVEAALEIDECALIPKLVAGMSKTKPDALNAAIARIRIVTDLTDEELHQSLSDVATPFDVAGWFGDTLLRRMNRSPAPAPHPIAATDPDFQPLISGPEIAAAGRRLQNCLSGDSKVVLAASGKAIFFVSKNEIAFEARRISIPPFFAVSEMLGAGNRSLTVSEWNWAIEALAARGIPVLANTDLDGDRLIQLIGHFDFGCAVEPPVPDVVQPIKAEAA